MDERLLRKMEGYGIKGDLLKWFKSFLSNRRQRVVINGETSSWKEVLSGVPQGSVIGPILFILFVNDMPDVVHGFIQLFADDAKIFAEMSSVDDQKELQADLDHLQDWALKWQMVFNASKCKVMHLGSKNPRLDYVMDNNTTLDTISEEKDLGVIVDDALKFDRHTESQVNKANKVLGLIRRSYENLDMDSFKLLYKSLVRSHLEYCNAVTYPQLEKQAKLLEGVQRRATKLVPGTKDLGYTDRLEKINLPSLYYRRNRGDMIEAYKYTHGIYKVDPSPLQLEDPGKATRGHNFKLAKKACTKNIRQKFFTMRVVNTWNRLPSQVAEAPTLNTFKNRLDAHWNSKTYSLDNNDF